MAAKKTSSWRWAALHVALYMVPFLLLFRPSAPAIALMAGSHLLIDRLRLAQYWCAFWGVGAAGWLPTRVARLVAYRKNRDAYRAFAAWKAAVDAAVAAHVRPDGAAWATVPPRPPHPFELGAVPAATAPPAPAYLAAWLLILVDNSWHLALNHLALACL